MIRCIATDENGPCDLTAIKREMCPKHYQRAFRMGVVGDKASIRPSCPECKGLMMEIRKPVALDLNVIRTRQCNVCGWRVMTLETPMPQEVIETWVKSRLKRTSVRTRKPRATRAAKGAAAPAESTGPTTSA